MKTLGAFQLDEILPHIGLGKPKLKLMTSEGSFRVKASSHRLECLKRNPCCVRCGLKGTTWILQVSVQHAPSVAINCFVKECPWCALKRKHAPVGTETPHLNLYGYLKGYRHRYGYVPDKKILMTQDHIMPRHAGGADNISNLQTMCSQCNSLKGGMLPAQYKEIALPHERSTYLGSVDVGGSRVGGPPALHAPEFHEAAASDCAAE